MDNDKLSPIRLRADQIAQEFHFDVWRESCEMIFDCEPLQHDWAFPGDSTIYMVDELMFTHVQFAATRFQRDAHHKAHGDGDGLLLQFNRSGRQKGLLANDCNLELGPDRITLQDFAHRYTAVSKKTDTFGVLIPRKLIHTNDLIYRKHPVLSWDIQSAQGRLLLSTLEAIWRDLPTTREEDARPLALGFIGLLNSILSGKDNFAQQDYVETATVLAMKDYIQANLSREDLNADLLSRTFQRSRATIYRMFQPLGGVQNYIRDLRLIRCLRELLANPHARRGSIRTIAERWGFYNAAHFSNLFKKRYGVRPSDLIGCYGSDFGPPETASRENNYTEQINILRSWTSRF